MEKQTPEYEDVRDIIVSIASVLEYLFVDNTWEKKDLNIVNLTCLWICELIRSDLRKINFNAKRFPFTPFVNENSRIQTQILNKMAAHLSTVPMDERENQAIFLFNSAAIWLVHNWILEGKAHYVDGKITFSFSDSSQEEPLSPTTLPEKD